MISHEVHLPPQVLVPRDVSLLPSREIEGSSARDGRSSAVVVMKCRIEMEIRAGTNDLREERSVSTHTARPETYVRI